MRLKTGTTPREDAFFDANVAVRITLFKFSPSEKYIAIRYRVSERRFVIVDLGYTS